MTTTKGTARDGPRRRPSTAPAKSVTPAATLPVARVVVDVSLPHLDRPFDYLVPAHLDEKVVPGCRVRVRFAGRLTDGFVLDRAESSEHDGKLSPLAKVVSPEPVLTGEIAGLARAVADRYAGTVSDVLRLAVPPRHARVEAEPCLEPSSPPEAPEPGPWGTYPAGPAFLAALSRGDSPRAAWTASPGEDWPGAMARAVGAALSGRRGALVVVSDGRDVARVDAALREALGADRHVVLTAEVGPAERYRRWLAVLRGRARAVVGTRAAMFAPVTDLGLVAVWDDGDDLHAEPHAPYPHVREVLGIRAGREGAAALFGGFTRTCETVRLVAAGWAKPLVAERASVRDAAPRIRPAGDDAELARDPAARSARLPSLAHRTAREALASGPVLVQVPRRGYLPAVACGRCRQLAQCPRCSGPLAMASADASPYCRWCGAVAGDWRCPRCEWPRVRAVTVGARRTAEELGRAFPSVPVRTSGRGGVLDRVGAEPALVVSTPGAEPVADGGYAAALLLDGAVLLGRPGLRSGEEALRRWLNAAALVRPADDGGRVVVLADGSLRPVQALLRWDPVSYADDELAERAQLRFPPAVTMAAVTGEREAIADLLAAARPELPSEAELLGPVPLDGRAAGAAVDGEAEQERALVRAPRRDVAAVARALHSGQATRSARRAGGGVRVNMDPLEPV